MFCTEAGADLRSGALPCGLVVVAGGITVNDHKYRGISRQEVPLAEDSDLEK